MIPTQTRRSALAQLFSNYSSLKFKNNTSIFSSSEESEKYAKTIELYAYNKAVQAKVPQVYAETLVNLKPLYYFWYLENKETISKIIKLFSAYKMYQILNEDSNRLAELWSHYTNNPLSWPIPPQDLENVSFIKKETSRLVKEYQEKKSQIVTKVATPQQVLHSHRTNLLELMVGLRRHIEINEISEVISTSQKLQECLEKITNLLTLPNLAPNSKSVDSSLKSESSDNVKLIIADYTLWNSINRTLGNCNQSITIFLSQNNQENTSISSSNTTTTTKTNTTTTIENNKNIQNLLLILLLLESDLKLLHELLSWTVHENHQTTLPLPITPQSQINDRSLKRKIDQVISESSSSLEQQQQQQQQQLSSTSGSTLTLETISNIHDLKTYFQQKYLNLKFIFGESFEELLHYGMRVIYSSNHQTHPIDYQLNIFFDSQFLPNNISLSYTRNNIRSTIPSLVTPFITNNKQSLHLQSIENTLNNSLQFYRHSQISSSSSSVLPISSSSITTQLQSHLSFIESTFINFLKSINKF